MSAENSMATTSAASSMPISAHRCVSGVPPRKYSVQSSGEGAVHEDFGVGEVDQLQDAVDHRVAEGDERVDRAVGETGDGELEEVIEQE